MGSIPTRAADRIKESLKRFQPILTTAKTRDVNESDTVVIVTDLLEAIFGYDKYAEITSEHLVKSTRCDLAIKLDGKVAFLLEVKAIGVELKDNHIKQAVDYAANSGIEWVGLTNGQSWHVYKVVFEKPIDHECIVQFDLLAMSARNNDDVELLSVLSKEGWAKSRLVEYDEQKQALSRFTIGALLMSDSVLEIVRRELRKVVGVMVQCDDIRKVLQAEVIKRDVLEGDKAAAATRTVKRVDRRSARGDGAKTDTESLSAAEST